MATVHRHIRAAPAFTPLIPCLKSLSHLPSSFTCVGERYHVRLQLAGVSRITLADRILVATRAASCRNQPADLLGQAWLLISPATAAP